MQDASKSRAASKSHAASKPRASAKARPGARTPAVKAERNHGKPRRDASAGSSAPLLSSPDSAAPDPWSNEAGHDLASRAYGRIEELFITTRIAPGATLRMQDLQASLGIGRTPVHQAVRRLAAETLLEIKPRNGLRVTPIDLTRERHLALLRRDLDRFVVAAAIGAMTSNQRAALLHMKRRIETAGAAMGLDAFNIIDRAFDRLLIEASGEPFLERVLGPLHAFGRRMGFVHITHMSRRVGLEGSIERHLEIMDAVLRGAPKAACAASDALVAFSLTMISELEESVDPALLDARFASARSFGEAQGGMTVSHRSQTDQPKGDA